MNTRRTLLGTALVAGLVLAGSFASGHVLAEDEAGDAAAKPAPKTPKRTVLVELFTSQG